MKMQQNMGLVALVSFVLLASGATVSAGTVMCSDFLGTIGVRVNSDVFADVNCTIGDGGFVDGNILADGTTVFVIAGGTVDGNIEQKGPGHIIVFQGVVDGNIKESEDGEVSIDSGVVNGNIEESGPGSVAVGDALNPVQIKGDIKETGDGFVAMVLNDESFLNGKTLEEGDGNLVISVNGTGLYKGDANEKNGGDLVTHGTGTFEGNIKEEGAGICTNNIPGDGGLFKGNACV